MIFKKPFKKNEQYPRFLWSTMTTQGRKETKSEIISLQNNQTFDVLNI
jgi:hypothetical protein